MHLVTPLVRVPGLALLVVVSLVSLVPLLACAPASPPAGDAEEEADVEEEAIILCAGPGESYGIQDFPCPASTVEGWVSAGDREDADGPRTRQHAWYLFAGLNQVEASGDFLWRTWPTSSQAFPGQFDSTSNVGVEQLDLTALPGARLEHPVPGTPRYVGKEKAELVESDPGVDDQNLSLPGAPEYSVPQAVQDAYPQCLQTSDGKVSLIDGPTLQNNGDVMVAGVIYSPDAEQWILDQELWNASYLDGLLPASDTDPPVAQEMPENSVVLKPMLWPVRGDGFTPLPLWDNLEPNADEVDDGACEVYSGFERQDLWTRAVAMTTRVGTSETTVTVSYLGSDDVLLAQPPYDSSTCEPASYQAQTVTYENVPVVGLDRFYQIRFSSSELEAMDPCDRALLDQSAYWSYGRAFASTDALVLIAMHMMTKEQPGWTFQSAWWFDGAWNQECSGGDERSQKQCKRYSGDRPTDISGATTWQNYLMTSTYGIHQKPGQDNSWPTDLSSNDTWPVAYNPYIELAATHPIETNCINCHRRAAWPSRLKTDRRFPERSSAYLLDGDDVPGLLDVFESNDAIFDGLVTVDSMWAVSDRAYYPDSSGSDE